MGFLGAAGLAARSIKKIKSRLQDTSKPGHTHGDDSSSNVGPKGGDSRFDNPGGGGSSVLGEVPRLEDKNIIGKGQVDTFSSLNDPLSVDRGGRTILPGGRAEDSSELDPVGIEPAMNPSLATPNTVGVDDTGMNELLSQ
jgi:hypothetical protein